MKATLSLNPGCWLTPHLPCIPCPKLPPKAIGDACLSGELRGRHGDGPVHEYLARTHELEENSGHVFVALVQ